MDTTNHANITIHLNGPQKGSARYVATGDDWAGESYGYVMLDGGPVDLAVFVHDRQQAEAIAAAFAELAAQFPEPVAELEPVAEPARLSGCTCDPIRGSHRPGCAWAAQPGPEVNTFPARMDVANVGGLGPDGPFVYRCYEGHAHGSPGWQSIEYDSPEAAADAARDHARAVHDMALPAALAELLAGADLS